MCCSFVVPSKSNRFTTATWRLGGIRRCTLVTGKVDAKRGAGLVELVVVAVELNVVLAEDGQAAVKFTATNQDTSMRDHTLQSVEVDGQKAALGDNATIAYNCALVADSKDGLERMPQDKNGNCIEYTATSLVNEGFAYGGNVPVTFKFDTGSVDVDATVSAPTLASEDLMTPANQDLVLTQRLSLAPLLIKTPLLPHR